MGVTALAMLVALGVEGAFGWPERVHARIGHPVTWLGAWIGWLDRRLNLGAPAARRGAGVLALLAVVTAAVAPALAVAWVLPGGIVGAVLTGLIAAPLVAGRSLHDHVAAVARPLAAGDLAGARAAVSMIVGRDPERLDQAGVARAALESLGENASDGVVAPVFWGVLLGLPGIAAYKAINTADSMIGHRTERHEAFGWASARVDDVVNWPAARLTALAFALASGRPGRAMAVAWRDAPGHRSPNGGWPEAALAAGLGCRLSGPRAYHAGVEDQPWINREAPDPDPEAVRRGLRLYVRAMALLAVGLGLLALV